ncbi:MAG: class I SAM-dependent methyltransferase [Phycisphaerales bacterium]|nr:MAG: class I SAM-dependent methyltransferase [Phycisphaerales bacterium]
MSDSAAICRSCAGSDLRLVLSLGKVALADRLLTDQTLSEPEPTYSLTVYFCSDCGLMQIAETVPPEVLFCNDYPYYSSFSPALLEHSHQNAEELIRTCSLGPDSLVVELASNDGYLLKNFVEHGIPVLGIDPADGPTRIAQENGVETLCTFFTEELAHRLRGEGRAADVVIANNVLAHVAGLNDFVRGIGALLKKNGTAVIEVPYVKDLVDNCEFDTIYHEHLCYFSVTALMALFARHSLSLNDIRQLTIHGGSLRLYVGHEVDVSPRVTSLIEEEVTEKIDQFAYYQDFSGRVTKIRESLLDLLSGLKREGKRIAAYGAAAKGATLINYVGIGKELIDFVVDRNIHKQGRYMPGKHLPIFAPERLVDEMPDYCLILAWNFADEIMEQQAEYVRRGGKFIVPVPQPRVLHNETASAG